MLKLLLTDQALQAKQGRFADDGVGMLQEQANGGHNLSLGLTAMAYHLKILSFVEECAVDAAHQRVGEVT